MITKEEYDKLNQLDRIELRLEIQALKEKYAGTLLEPFISTIVFLLYFMAIFITLHYNFSVSLMMFNVMRNVILLSILFAIPLLIYDLIQVGKKKEERNDLEKKYFSKNPKRK